MHTVNLVLYIIAALSFAFAVKYKRIEIVAFGLLAWVMVPAIAAFNAVAS